MRIRPVLFFAEADCEKRVAADAHDHRKGHDEKADGKAERDSGDSQVADAGSDKIPIDDVVERFDDHAHDGGNRKCEKQPGNACSPDSVQLGG